MKRHHMRVAVNVCRGSEADALRGVAHQTQTAYKDNRYEQPKMKDRGEVSSVPRPLDRRMHTLILTGSLDRGSVRQLEAELERLCEEGVTGITLDLRRLTNIETIGVAVVAFRCGLYRRRGYDLALIRGPRRVQRAFEQAGLGELLPFQEATANLEQGHEALEVEEVLSARPGFSGGTRSGTPKRTAPLTHGQAVVSAGG